MAATADCVNTQSKNGRNLTPISILEAAGKVLGHIELDPASDLIANKAVKAERIYTVEQDGFSQDWKAHTVWLNAPGRSRSKGKLITASEWYRKLHRLWRFNQVEHAIAMVYRAGSIGSLGIDLLTDATICLTCSGVDNPIVNGSGRLSFETVEGDRRIAQTSNTQSSLIFLLSDRVEIQLSFVEHFSQFGVIK